MSDDNFIVNPNNNLKIPEWVNKAYFLKILLQDEPKYESVLNFTPVAAIPPGENFTSIMIRIYIELAMKDGSIKQKRYILKTMLADEKGGKMIKEAGIFDKELQMYQTYLPAFEDIYRTAGAHIQLAPKCLQAEEREEGINFVFEDLSEQNFQNAGRINGLDEAHMKAALYKLAEFHAAAAAYVERNGIFPEVFNEGFMSKRFKHTQDRTFKIQRETYLKSMYAWELDNIDEYINSFPNADQFSKMCLSNLDVDPEDFNTLTHGDLWSSNLLYKYYPDGNIDSAILLDYQLCKYGSPAQDLLFLITISAAKDIRIKKFDMFVRIYWERLIVCLQLVKYQQQLPSLRDLHKSMLKKSNTFYAFAAIFNHMPTIFFPPNGEINLQTVLSENEEGQQLRIKLYSHPPFIAAMKDIYPFFYHRGIFNFKYFE